MTNKQKATTTNDTSKSNITTRQRYRWLTFAILTLTLVVVPFALYYLNYYEERTEFEEMRKFRALSQLDRSLQHTIGNLDRVFDSVEKSTARERLKDQQGSDALRKEQALLRENLTRGAAPWLERQISLFNTSIRTSKEFNSACQKMIQDTQEAGQALLAYLRAPESWHADAANGGVSPQSLRVNLTHGIKQLLDAKNQCRVVDSKAFASTLEVADDFLTQDIENYVNALANTDTAFLPTVIEQVRNNPAFKHANFDPCESKGSSCEAGTFYQQNKLGTVLIQSSDDSNNAFTVLMADIVEAYSSLVADEFDQLIIVDGGGKIMHQMTPNNTSRKRLGNRIGIDPYRVDFVRYQSLAPILSGIQPDGSGGAQAANDAHIETVYHSSTRRIQASEIEFRAFVHPSGLRIPAQGRNAEPPPKPWYLIGIVKESRFRDGALAASVVTTGPVLLAIFAGLALIPIFWLQMSDRYVRLSHIPIALVLFGSFVLIATATLTLTHAVYQRDFEQANDDKLEQLNHKISKAFHTELVSKLNLLKVRSQELYQNLATSEQPWAQCQSVKFFQDDAQSLAFDTLVLIDEEGQSLPPTCSRRPSSPDSLDLSQRDYFNKLITGEGWELPNLHGELIVEPQPQQKFYLERINSYLDGRLESILSIPITERTSFADPTVNSAPPKPAVVAAMVTDFAALTYAVLPAHVSFALLESGSGRVLFHSMNERSLIENFVDETSGSEQLITKLDARSKGHLTFDYHGETQRAYVKPLTGLPLVLVTFGGNEIYSEMLFRSLLSAIVITIVIFSVMVLTALIAGYLVVGSMNRNRGVFSWFWSSPISANAQVWSAIAVIAQLLGLSIVLVNITVPLDQAFLYCMSVALQGIILINVITYNDGSYESYKIKLRITCFAGFVALLVWVAGLHWWLLALQMLSAAIVFALSRKFPGRKIQYGTKFTKGFAGILVGVGAMVAWIGHETSLQQYSQAFQRYAVEQSAQAADYRWQRTKTLDWFYRLTTPAAYHLESNEDVFARFAGQLAGSFCDGIYTAPWDAAKHENKSCENHLRPRIDCPNPDSADRLTTLLASIPAFSPLSAALNERLVADASQSTCSLNENRLASRMREKPNYYLMEQVASSKDLLNKRLAWPFLFQPLIWVGLIVLLAYLVARLVSRRLSGAELSLSNMEVYDPSRQEARCAIVIAASHSKKEQILDKLKQNNFTILENLDNLPHVNNKSLYVVNEFESAITQGSDRANLLQQVTACQSAGVTVVVFSDIVPSYWLSTLERSSLLDIASPTEFATDFIAWSTALQKFAVYAAEPITNRTVTVASFRTELHKLLRTKQRFVHEYHHQWALSTNEERDILRSLAVNGVLNPQNVEALQSLVSRGILTSSEALYIRSEGFQHFIANDVDHTKLDTWYAQSTGSIWPALWPTLLIVAVVGGVFFTLAGQDTVNATVAVFGAIATAIPVLLGLVAAYRGGGDKES